MAIKITRDILESYLHCRYKAFLKVTGQEGVRSNYEALSVSVRDEARLRATETILARHKEGEVARNIVLTAASLKQGPSFILDATLEDDSFSLRFDGLTRVEGP